MDCKAEERTLLIAPSNAGKSHDMIRRRAVESKNTHTPIYFTLNSLPVVDQELEHFKKNFSNIVVKRGTDEEYLSMDAFVGTFDHNYRIDVCGVVNYAPKDRDRQVMFDEGDQIGFGLPNYDAVKARMAESILRVLNPEDKFILASASIMQIAAIDFQFTNVDIHHPWKPGYRCMIDFFDNTTRHEQATISDTSMELLKQGKSLTEEVRFWLDKATPDRKLGINVTNFVAERHKGDFLRNIERLFIAANRRVFVVKGGMDKLPVDDINYKLADVVLLGQPAGRAMVLPNLYYTIWDCGLLIDALTQEQRQNNFFTDDEPSYYITTQIGKERLEQANRITTWLYHTASYWACLPFEEKKAWFEQNMPYYEKINLFSKGKEGDYIEKKARMDPVFKWEWDPDEPDKVLDMLTKSGYYMIDKWGFTTGEEGTYKARNEDALDIINKNPLLSPSRYGKDMLGRKVVPFGLPKAAGRFYVELCTLMPEGGVPPKWVQFHIEDGKVYIAAYDSSINHSGKKKLRLKNERK